MQFKSPEMKEELNNACIALKNVAYTFANLSMDVGVEPVVTRVLEKVEGESGVHQDYRAIDFRNEHDGKFLYTADQIKHLVEAMNKLFPRDDGKLVCIHHAFVDHNHPENGAGQFHFHLQIPYKWKYSPTIQPIPYLNKGTY